MKQVKRASLAFVLAMVLATGLVPAGALTALAEPANTPAKTSQDSSTTNEITATTGGVCQAAEEPSADASASEPATDGILVIPNANSWLRSGDMAEQQLEQAGLRVTDRMETFDGVILAAEPTEGQSDEEAAAAAQALPGVATAQPNYLYSLIDDVVEPAPANAATPEAIATPASPATDTPTPGSSLLATPRANDPFAQISSPTTNPNQYWLYNAGLIDAWNSATTDGTVTVAVLDSGVKASHEDLAANVLRNLAWDAYYNKPLDFANANEGDNGGHGTHVAGIVAGVANNAKGIAGASYNACVLPVKVVDDSASKGSTTKSLIAAYEYVFALAEAGRCPDIRVVNMSLGSYNEAVNDRLFENAITRARNEFGIVTVCAGGNGDSVTPYTKPSYPSDFAASVSVTALEPDGTNIVWSDYNQYKDISAPGRNVWSTIVNNNSVANGPYGPKSGTSMASPLVAGAFALLFAAVPDATVDEACEAVYATARAINDPVNDRRQTSGSHGAIDVAAALNYLEANHVKHFDDVHEYDWFYDTVNFATENGIMNGYAGTNLFGPNDVMTREQAAAVLYNYLGHGAIAPAAPQTDINQADWYARPVNWAIATGYMNGYDSRTFGVGDSLTREQVACIIANVTGNSTTQANPAKFNALPDHNATSSWARIGTIWAVDKGVINGVEQPDGTRTLSPLTPATRAEMAAVIKNAILSGLL